MALVIKSRQDLINDIINTIKNRDPAIETGFGPAKDLVVDPVSLVGRDVYQQIKRVYLVQFLQNASQMTQEELDDLGTSWGVARRGPTNATGSVFFLTSSQPNTDITIPLGTPVATAPVAGSVTFQSFVTTAAVTIFAGSASSFFNPLSGFFEFEVPIRALTPGSSGIVAAGTIRTLQRQVPGISSIINKSATIAGRDSETQTDYARRISLVLRGNAKGTATGIRRFSFADSRVVDAAVVQAGDPLLTRAELVAGAVDVYIQGQEPTVDQQPEIYSGLDVAFRNEPIIFPSPITSVVASLAGTMVEGTHFFVVEDVVLGGSSEARNLLRWNRGAAGLPAPGETFTIEYSFDKLIQDLQTSLQSLDNDILTDVLFRRSEQVDIIISVSVKVAPDVSLADISGAITSAITSVINTKELGQSVFPSDIDVAIREVPGVDEVILPLTQMAVLGSQGSSVITVNKNQYVHIEDTNVALDITT